MKLRHQCNIYLGSIHLFFFALCIVLFGEHLIWLFTAEVLLVVSFVLGLRLTGRFFDALDLIKSGASFIAERDFTTRFTLTGTDEVDRMIEVYNSMIDQLREERIQFQEQSILLDKLIEASLTGVVLLNPDGRIRMVNPVAGRMLNGNAQELVGKNLGQLESQFADELRRLERGSRQIISVGGRRRMRCQKLEFTNQGCRHEFILIEELTEEIRKSEKESYEKLVRLVSHEVSNTVASTTSLLESFRNYANQLGEEDRSDFETALQVAIARNGQLDKFVHRFAEVVRIPEPVLEECDLEVLIRNTLVLLSSELDRRGISTALKLEAQSKPILMDRGQMEHVLVNIFKNAFEAIEADGTITIRLGKEGARDLLVIEDTGPGISERERNRLFKPFFSTKEVGHGIGLAVVQEILENHGFDFSLEAASPAGGAKFTIDFG